MCALSRSLLAYNTYIPTYTMALFIHHPIIRHPYEKNSITVHIINFYSVGISTIIYIYPDSLTRAFIQRGLINFPITLDTFAHIRKPRMQELSSIHAGILINVLWFFACNRPYDLSLSKSLLSFPNYSSPLDYSILFSCIDRIFLCLMHKGKNWKKKWKRKDSSIDFPFSLP